MSIQLCHRQIENLKVALMSVFNLAYMARCDTLEFFDFYLKWLHLKARTQLTIGTPALHTFTEYMRAEICSTKLFLFLKKSQSDWHKFSSSIH